MAHTSSVSFAFNGAADVEFEYLDQSSSCKMTARRPSSNLGIDGFVQFEKIGFI